MKITYIPKKVAAECSQVDLYKANANIVTRTQAGGGKDLMGTAEDWLWVCEREAVTGEGGRERSGAVRKMYTCPEDIVKIYIPAQPMLLLFRFNLDLAIIIEIGLQIEVCEINVLE